MVRCCRAQLLSRINPRRDGDSPSPDCPSTPDVGRSIPDHHRFTADHRPLQSLTHHRQRHMRNIIPVRMMITKSPGILEKVINPEMPQLGHRTLKIVARQQTQMHIPTLAQ